LERESSPQPGGIRWLVWVELPFIYFALTTCITRRQTQSEAAGLAVGVDAIVRHDYFNFVLHIGHWVRFPANIPISAQLEHTK
jgi:hypothetical protein